ncbi:MAG: FAD-dependent oxidoreductase [Bacteroidia bacterium]|nr:MAG: FAD-dependent oxidoreductase [Bacteroidia bacterium]
MKNVDVIIVGSGIAGINLAWEFYHRNISFVIISQPKLSQSSLIAPGVWNPIVFKRITTTWNASLLINELYRFYNRIENLLQKNLIQNLKIWHVLNSHDEEKLWIQKAEMYPRFLNSIQTFENQYHSGLKKDIKVGEVIQCGRLNTSEYIYYSIKFFENQNWFIESFFYPDLLYIKENQIEYDSIRAKHIVFCEGYKVKDNPFFSFVPLKPAKGEIIEIETKNNILPENTILHKHISIIPNGHHKYLIGSNYDWENLNDEPTEGVKQKFLKEFEELFDVDYEVIGHYAGVRPAADRRPILGHHPEYKNLWIFNGLGTKGIMLSPYCSKILAEAIFNGKCIDDEINVTRFLK